jgi:hypothetical protein
MKILTSLIATVVTVITINAQPKPTSAADYNGTFTYAVSESNRAFPFIFTVVTETFEGGRLAYTQTDVAERQAEGIERETKTLIKGVKTLRAYSISVGFDNNTYCSTDSIRWKGPQKFVCPGPEGSGMMRLYGPRTPKSVEYSVEDKTVDGQPVKIYRKYAIYAASWRGGKEEFEEEIATIDARGFFVSVTDREGTLDPKTITLKRRQTWDFKTKFNPVVAPK